MVDEIGISDDVVANVAAFLSADTTDVLAADTADVLSAAKSADCGCYQRQTYGFPAMAASGVVVSRHIVTLKFGTCGPGICYRILNLV